MKTSTMSAILAPAALANAQWWGGAPECAQNCFSSFWSSESNWPAATSYCGANNNGASVASCFNSACSATPTAVASYSSLTSSLCDRWASCSSAGSTGVYTVNLPAFTGTYPGGNFGPGGRGGPGGGPWGGKGGGDNWDDASKTWTGGAYTVTGCEWDGSPWAGGPWGYGGSGQGDSPWAPWGKDWKWSTATQTITQVLTVTNGGVTALTTSIGPATVALAVSGDTTQTSIIAAGAAASPTGSGAASGPGSDSLALKVVGSLLGGFVVVAGLL